MRALVQHLEVQRIDGRDVRVALLTLEDDGVLVEGEEVHLTRPLPVAASAVSRCGDCRSWRRLDVYVPEQDASVLSEFGTCLRADGEQLRMHPESMSLVPTDVEIIGARDAATCDGSGYFSALITRDRFGCVGFEKTEKV